MRRLLVLVFLFAAGLGFSQDFLGRWSVVKVFTTGNFQREDESRMLVLIRQTLVSESKIEGVILPEKTGIEFSINPNNQAQHVTLSNDGLLLMSMNWTIRETAGPPVDPQDLTLKVWLEGETDYDLYSILFNDERTLVFTDRSRIGSRFLDIYYLERQN